MPSAVVSFRVDAKEIKRLKRQGVNPNEFAKAAFELSLKRVQVEGSIAWYEAHPFSPVDRRPAEKIIREMRDTR